MRRTSAFGVVLYEMLTGRRLFEGETLSDLLAAVPKTAPDFTALPAGVPSRVRRLLGRCLKEDPRERLHDIADARIELTDEEEVVPAAPVTVPPRRASALVPWAVAALAIAAAAGWALLAGRSRAEPPRALNLAVLPPSDTVSSGPIDLSLDGRQLAFTAAGDDGRARAYVRSLDVAEARALAGTEGADAPFFSPDSRSIGFFADGKLKRVDLAGGPARELADAPEHRGGSSGAQNIIVFAPEGGGPIFRVSASGGPVAPVTTLDPAAQETSHRWPRFLPDGKRFLFMSRKPKPPGRLAVEAASVDGGPRTRLVESNTGGVVARGHLYFVRETTLLAQAFDSRTLTVEGDPVPVAEGVWRNLNTDGLATDRLLMGRPGTVRPVPSGSRRGRRAHAAPPERRLEVPGELVPRRALPELHPERARSAAGHLNPADDGGSQALPDRPDARRGVGLGVLPRRAVPRLRLRRVRPPRGPRANVPRLHALA